MQHDNTNRGVAFPNEYKKSENHPDYRGKGNFNGVDFEFGIWKKDYEKDGETKEMLSFSFSEPYVKDVKLSEKSVDNIKKKMADEDEPINLDDIPF